MDNSWDVRRDAEIAARVEQSAWDLTDDVWSPTSEEQTEQYEVSRGILGLNYSNEVNPHMVENHQKFLDSLGYVLH